MELDEALLEKCLRAAAGAPARTGRTRAARRRLPHRGTGQHRAGRRRHPHAGRAAHGGAHVRALPACDFNPDEVVALGAAVQAGLKANDAALDEVVMTDVAPYSLGVAVSHRFGRQRYRRTGTSTPSSSATARCRSAARRRTYPAPDAQLPSS
jgi:hypothetical protein